MSVTLLVSLARIISVHDCRLSQQKKMTEIYITDYIITLIGTSLIIFFFCEVLIKTSALMFRFGMTSPPPFKLNRNEAYLIVPGFGGRTSATAGRISTVYELFSSIETSEQTSGAVVKQTCMLFQILLAVPVSVYRIGLKFHGT